MPYPKKIVFLIFIFIAFLESCIVLPVPESALFPAEQIGKINDVKNLQEIYLKKNDSTKINALYLDNPEAEKVILFLHGNGGSIWDASYFKFYKQIEKIGFDVFAIDYEGYGKSGGHPSVKNLYQDGNLAYSYLSKKYDADKIIIWGFSLGTIPSCRLASEGKGSKIILTGCLKDSKTAIKNEKRIIVSAPKRWLLRLKVDSALTFNPMADISKAKQAVLIISGTKDRIAPTKTVRQIFEKIQNKHKELYVLKGIDHNASLAAKGVFAKVKAFINQ